MHTTFSQRSQVVSVICALISYQYNPILVMYKVCAIKVAAVMMMVLLFHQIGVELVRVFAIQ